MIKLDLDGFNTAKKVGTVRELHKGSYVWRWCTGYWAVLEKTVSLRQEKLVDIRRGG